MTDKEEYVSGEQYQAMKSQKHKKQASTGWQKPVAMIVVALVIAGLSFYAGKSYEKSHDKSTTATSSKPGGGFGRFSGTRPDIGTVTAISSSSITISTQSGSSETFSITSSTTITDSGQTVSASSIQSGTRVFIIPDTTNTNQAARILVNPSFGGFGGGSQDGNGSNTSGGSSTSGSQTTGTLN